LAPASAGIRHFLAENLSATSATGRPVQERDQSVVLPGGMVWDLWKEGQVRAEKYITGFFNICEVAEEDQALKVKGSGSGSRVRMVRYLPYIASSSLRAPDSIHSAKRINILHTP
jgi:hypothetical protein